MKFDPYCLDRIYIFVFHIHDIDESKLYGADGKVTHRDLEAIDSKMLRTVNQCDILLFVRDYSTIGVVQKHELTL